MNLRSVFQKPHLAWLWVSQLFSAIGDQLFSVALTWMVVEKVGSSVAFVNGAGMATALLLGLIGGVYADRWNHRVTMIRVDVLRAVVVGLLPLFNRFGGLQLWQFVLVVIVVEALGTLFDPAMQASLPELCGDSLVLQTTNALMDGTQRMARVLGPGLTGALLLVLALPHFFAVDTMTFLFSALVLVMRKPYFVKRKAAATTTFVQEREELERPTLDHAESERPTLWGDIRTSLHLLRGHKTLSWALASLGIVNVAWNAVYATGIPLLAEHRLSGGTATFGLIVGAYGIGNVVSLFVMSALPWRMNIFMMFIGQLLLGAGFLLLSVSTTIGLAMGATTLAAFGSPMGDLIMLTMIQSDFPAQHIGKMYSLRKLISGMGLLLGSLMAAPIFTWASISVAIQMFTYLIILVGLIGVLRFRRAQSHAHPATHQGNQVVEKESSLC